MATVSAIKDQLNTRLGDSTDRTFTSAEKDEFLSSAVNDEHVFKIARATTTTVGGQASYDISAFNIDDLTEVQVDIVGNGYPEVIERDGYEVIDDDLYFDISHQGIPTGKTMVLIGRQKLTTSDDIPTYLVEYVLTLATLEAYRRLAASYTTRFLKNDVTLSEILQVIADLERKAERLRGSLQNNRAVKG